VIRERNGKYEVVVYLGRDAAGRRRSISRTEPTLAKAKSRERTLLRSAEDAKGASTSTATFGHLMDRWLEHARIEESTRYVARQQIEKHLRPYLGQVRVAKLRAEDLDELYRRLERGDKNAKPLAASTVRRLHATVRSVLALAVRWEWVAKNPAERAQPPAERRDEPVAPSTDAVVAFLQGCSEEPELAMFVRLDAVTGMRRAEVCALRRSDLDLELGSVRSVRALGTAKGKPYVKATKTGTRHSIALDAETCQQLSLHLKGQDEIAAHTGCEIADGYVFSLVEDCSTPMRPDYVSKRVRARANEIPGAKGLTLRGLRHWMITEGLDAGHSIKAVSGRAGHARTSTTGDRYAAWIPATDVTLAEQLADRLARPSP